MSLKYKINDSLMAFDIVNEGIILSITDSELITIDENEDTILEIVKAFLEPKSYEEAYLLASKNMYIDTDLFEECFEFMKSNNVLKEMRNNNSILSDYQKNKYKRQISSFNSLKGIEADTSEIIQKRICQSTVCIIGIGGTGSYLSLALTMIGVEHLILIDFDQVELSNTARQILYDETDVGKYKINAAKEKLLKYNRNIKVNIHNVNIKSGDDLEFLCQYSIDLLVLCADTPRGEIQYITDEIAQKNKIPWFCYGPFNQSQVAIGPMIIPGKTMSYSELFPHNVSAHTNRVNEINKKFVASVCDPYNGFASQFAAIEAFKYLSGIKNTTIINRRYCIDTDNWTMEFEDYYE